MYDTEWDRRVFGGVNSPEFEELINDAEIKEPSGDYTWFAEIPPITREPEVNAEVESYSADVEISKDVSEAIAETTSYLETFNVIYRDGDTDDWNLNIVGLRNEVFRTDDFDELEVDQFKTY